MPRIFDNIKENLLPALLKTLENSERADFCVGYFNLRGWKSLHQQVDNWTGGENSCCRLLIGMHKSPMEILKEDHSLISKPEGMDPKEAKLTQKRLAGEFRTQLTTGAPSNADEIGLRILSRQLKEKKLVVKLFGRHPLHAKLYLLYRDDFNNPITGYLGSSNLTFAGLSRQGELNVDILDQDACKKLETWFNDRWDDRFCIDISNELAEIIDTSWAREDLISPYHIYLKIAYHLAYEARSGMTEFAIPKDLDNILFEFQKKAVQTAAHHVNKRGGVVIGDVVGLGKTLMATALAKVCQESVNQAWRTLIICPKNLMKMWEDYNYDYHLEAKVMPISLVQRDLPDLRIYKLVIIDESHNLRNREGKRFKAIKEYIAENDSRVIMLTATPYNKTFLDLSSQLRLFLEEGQDLGIKPEHYIRKIDELEFKRRYQCPLNSITAFEKSDEINDWRNLMRYYLVRRTRSFILANYAHTDESNGRKYLKYPNGTRAYFPDRVPRTLKFKIDDKNPDDQYARLYSEKVVKMISELNLPRYGLANFLTVDADQNATCDEKQIIDNLARAGKRLMGFCRTHLFKRLESSGFSFLKSINSHLLRNHLFLYAIENDLPLPIGQLGFEIFDDQSNDEDADSILISQSMEDYNYDDEELSDDTEDQDDIPEILSESAFKYTAEQIYQDFQSRLKKRYKWIRPKLFTELLTEYLQEDSKKLLQLLKNAGEWDSSEDTKLQVLTDLLLNKHPNEKVLIFSQYADTVEYLYNELKNRIDSIEMVTGDSSNPTEIAYRFSPESNHYVFKKDENPIRVVLSTDVLSEGQNLQDAFIVLNYDLPWTIIKLVQRVGRVDRIGQKAEKIWCYSFLPADGIERIIRLRARVRQRLEENGEVLGSDERFFEDEDERSNLENLYTENSSLLDKEMDSEVDLASQAYEIWRQATENNPALKKTIEELPDVVYSTRKYQPKNLPEGVIVYLKTANDSDALAYVGKDGKSISESPMEILELAKCDPDTPAIPKHPDHHEIVQKGVEWMVSEEKSIGGQLGRPSGARFRTYERLKKYIEELERKNSLMLTRELQRSLDDIYQFPLRESARDILNRQLRTGLSDQQLADLVQSLREEDKLTLGQDEIKPHEPQIICSLGLFENTEED